MSIVVGGVTHYAFGPAVALAGDGTFVDDSDVVTFYASEVASAPLVPRDATGSPTTAAVRLGRLPLVYLPQLDTVWADAGLGRFPVTSSEVGALAAAAPVLASAAQAAAVSAQAAALEAQAPSNAQTDAALLRAFDGATDGDLLGYSADLGRAQPVPALGAEFLDEAFNNTGTPLVLTGTAQAVGPQLTLQPTDRDVWLAFGALATTTTQGGTPSQPIVFVEEVNPADPEFGLVLQDAGLVPASFLGSAKLKDLHRIGPIAAPRTFRMMGQKVGPAVMQLQNGLFIPGPPVQKRRYCRSWLAAYAL